MATHDMQVIEQKADYGRLGPVGAVLAVIGFGLLLGLGPSLIGAGGNLFGSYMFGLMFWTSVTLGFFGLSLLHHATRGTWSVSVMRIYEAGGGWPTLVMMAVLFIPLVALGGMNHLYEWMDPTVVANDPILAHKAAYLNQGRWIFSLCGYFIIWIIWAVAGRRSTLLQDKTKDFKLEDKRMSLGAAGMVMFFVTATFAVVDWIMSMEPHWYSTMYGAWMVVNAAYGALALATYLVCKNAKREPYASVISPQLTKDLGNMQFTLTMLWGYTTLSQFLIIWNGNIPETTAYFTRRMATFAPGIQGNNWAILGFIIIIGTFFIPFYCLLAPRVKRYTQNLAKLSAFMFVMALLNMYLIVIPAVPGRAELGPISVYTLPDLFATLGIGGLWLIAFGAMSRRAPLIPLYDNRLQEAVKNAH